MLEPAETQIDMFDDSGWTPDELLAQAWIAGTSIGWEDMDEYDEFPMKP